MSGFVHTSSVKTLATVGLALMMLVSPAVADHVHTDVELGYANGHIEIEFPAHGPVYPSAFPTTGDFEQFTDDPGFATHAAEGLVVGAGDNIDYRILGPLLYHDGTGFAAVPAGAKIVIGDKPSGTLDVSASTTGPISGPGVIAVADGDGHVHAHIDFTLEPQSLDTSEYGAYGLELQLTSDAAGIADSEPFGIVFNFGLEETVFEAIVDQWPEPMSLSMIGAGVAMVLLIRRGR